MINKDDLMGNQTIQNAVVPYVENIHSEKNQKKNEAFYKKLRKKIDSWSKDKNCPDTLKNIILLVPDLFYLLWKISLDPSLPQKYKAKVAYAIIYFISPLDIIPDALGPWAYIDDAFVAITTINTLINKLEQEYVQQFWYGDPNVLSNLQALVKECDNLLVFIVKELIPRALGRNDEPLIK